MATSANASYGLSAYIHSQNPKLDKAEVAEIDRTIYQVAAQFNLDPKIIAAVIAVESRFRPMAVGGSHGELGLMQLRPEYHALNIRDEGQRKSHLLVASANIVAGAKYLAALKEVFAPLHEGIHWVEFYNRGPHGRVPKVWKYSQKVLHEYNRIVVMRAQQTATLSGY